MQFYIYDKNRTTLLFRVYCAPENVDVGMDYYRRYNEDKLSPSQCALRIEQLQLLKKEKKAAGTPTQQPKFKDGPDTQTNPSHSIGF